MRRYLPAIILALICWIALAGCRTSFDAGQSRMLPEPDPARAAQFPATDLAEGKRLYEIKCAKCHKFYNPAEYGRSEWHLWMQKMSRKSHLKPDEQQLLSRYLDLFRPASQAGGSGI